MGREPQEHGMKLPLTKQFDAVWSSIDGYEKRVDRRLVEMTALAAALLDHVGGTFVFDPRRFEGRSMSIEPEMPYQDGRIVYNLVDLAPTDG